MAERGEDRVPTAAPSGGSRLRATGRAAIWAAFAIALVLATKPAWGYFVFGYEPTIADLLSLRCFTRR